MPKFTLEKKKGSFGELFKTRDDGTKEAWGTIEDFDRLFDECVKKWGNNWDLNKVLIAIKESEII